jgi:hypothetical protein
MARRAVASAPVLARLLLVALAAVAAVVAVQQLHHDHGCTTLLDDIAKGPAANLDGLAAQTLDRCGDPRDRIVIVAALVARKKRADAVAVVRRMTAANPDDYLGWLVLGRATRDRAALRRAHTLNPRGVPGP